MRSILRLPDDVETRTRSAAKLLIASLPGFRGRTTILECVEQSGIKHDRPLPMSFYQSAQFIQIQNVLSPEDHSDLLNYVFDRQNHFVSTSTSTGEIDYRYSTILYYCEEYEHWIIDKVKTFLSRLLEEWQIEPFVISQIEAQLTAHNDGNYYKIHNDNGSEDAANRILSYVYYFNREPKNFSGGALRIYDLNVKNGLYLQAESYQEIQPINNSIVFFPSHFLHEVLPVICPSRQFADSRFTLNGWVRRATV